MGAFDVYSQFLVPVSSTESTADVDTMCGMIDRILASCSGQHKLAVCLCIQHFKSFKGNSVSSIRLSERSYLLEC